MGGANSAPGMQRSRTGPRLPGAGGGQSQGQDGDRWAGPCLQALGERLGVLLMETAHPSITLHSRLAKCLFPGLYK